MSKLRIAVAVLSTISGLSLLGACQGTDDEPVGSGAAPLTAACVDSAGVIPVGAWVCGEDALLECDSHDGAHPDFIYAELGAGGVCLNETLTVSSPGPFLPGVYQISVDVSSNGQPPSELCHSTLTVVDTVAPVVTTHDTVLWSPNHKMHHVTLADCVTVDDACDPSPKGWFTGASSDEAPDDLGDGHTEPDIDGLGCDGVDLRAERQGGGDGRVYTLSFHVEDAAGHGVDGTCHVTVPHDQSGSAAVDSGEAYHVDLPAGSCPP
ncbi:MAG: hypothetical protein U0359_25685 [Byssovorax sp.]